MKIIAVTGNHQAGASAGSMSMRVLADSALLHSNLPFFMPTNVAPEWTVHLAVGVRIGRLGKCISPRFAGRYRTDVMACLVAEPKGEWVDLTDARMSSCDGAVMVGEAVPGIEPRQAEATLLVGQRKAARLQCAEMSLSFDELIAEASRGMTLKTGDLLLDVSPQAVDIVPGDNLWARLDSQPSLEIRVK